MRWAGIQGRLRQSHSWFTEVLPEGPLGEGGCVSSGQYGIRFKSSVSTRKTARFRNSSSNNTGDEGSDNRSNGSASHAVIVAQFEELLQKWAPKTPLLLDALQVHLKPMIVCRVLKKLPNTYSASNFFNWAKEKRGYQHNVYTYTALINHFGRGKDFEAIDSVLAEMSEVGCGMSIVTFSSLLHWYRHAKNLAGVRRVWKHMQMEGCPSNEYTYTTYIDALAKGGCYQEALEIFKQMQESECKPNMFTYNVLIHCLAEAGKLDGACEIFNKILELRQRPNFVTYSILVASHEKAGKLDQAVYFFKKMMEAGLTPSFALRSLLFKALMTKDRPSELAELTQMCSWEESMGETRADKQKPKVDGVHGKNPPSPVKLGELLIRWGPETERELKLLTPNLPSQYLSNVFGHLSGSPDVAWRFFKWLRCQKSYELSKYVFGQLMDILGKAGQVDTQLEVLAEAEAANAANGVMYNTLIHSYCMRKRPDAALEVLEKMKEHGHKPNAHTYTMLIDLLSKTRNHPHAMKKYVEMVNANCKPNMHTYTVIIHSLARSGKVNAANTLFERLPSLGISPSVVTYSVLMQAFLRERNVEKALELYETMRSDGITPSPVALRVMTGGLRALGLHDKAELLLRQEPSLPGKPVKSGKLHWGVEAEKDIQAILLRWFSE